MLFLFLSLALSCSSATDEPSSTSARSLPNIVLVIGCTLRRDRLTPYTSDLKTAPFLNELAKSGALFEQHYAQAPWTRPSLGSILTGLYPRRLNLDSKNDARQSRVLSENWSTIAEFLKDAGYRTIGVASNPNALKRFGFGQGFDVYEDTKGTTVEGVSLTSAQQQTQLILKELESASKETPFYAQIMTVDTHIRVRYEKEDWIALFGESYRSPSKRQHRIDSYDAAVHYWDRQIKTLYEQVTTLYPNTLFIITADHGEGLSLPKHHGDGHGNFLYESTIHIPHLWIHPSISPQKINSLTRNIDLLPSLLEFLNISTEAHFDGISYLPSVFEGSPHTAKFNISETFFRSSNKIALTNSDFHLIKNNKNGDISLFSTADKDAQQDLSQKELVTVRSLLEQLAVWEQKTIQGQGESIIISSEERAWLKAMGYLD